MQSAKLREIPVMFRASKYYPWFQSVCQLAMIVGTAAAVALISNHFRLTPLLLVGNWSAEARLTNASGRNMAISLSDAKTLHMSGSAVFLDARFSDDFSKGHIQGAKSLPWAEAEQRVMEVVANMPNDAAIITYCDGDTCDLSRELALFLESLGFSNVRVLVNGWTMWQGAGLPIQTGNQEEKKG